MDHLPGPLALALDSASSRLGFPQGKVLFLALQLALLPLGWAHARVADRWLVTGCRWRWV